MDYRDQADKAETRIVSELDKHAQGARIAAWVIAGLNGIGTIMNLMSANLFGAVLSFATAIVLLWLLVKTRLPGQTV